MKSRLGWGSSARSTVGSGRSSSAPGGCPAANCCWGWRRRNWPARTASRGWTGSGPTRAAPCWPKHRWRRARPQASWPVGLDLFSWPGSRPPWPASTRAGWRWPRRRCEPGWCCAGVRSGRVHLASWAQAELPLAAELIAGNDDVRPGAGELLTRALAVLPAQVCGRPRVRADAGYFDATLAPTAVTAGCDFAIAAKRNPAAWRALSAVPDTDWCDARGMAGGQVAACDYTPTGWPEGTYTIIRRVKIGVEQLSADPRSRRRRTVAKDQLALALGGAVDHVWAVSFIVTNIPASHGDYVGLEAWFRNRTSIEERFREAKHGGGLNHLPSVIFRRRSGQRVDLRVCLVDGVVDAALPSLLSAWADGLGALLPGRVAAGRLACGLGCACRAEGFG